MSKGSLSKPSIVITLLFWIFAITNARHIITAEDQQQVAHHKTFNHDAHHKDVLEEDNPRHHHIRPLGSSVDHMEKRGLSMQEESSDDTIRSNDVNDGYDEYPVRKVPRIP